MRPLRLPAKHLALLGGLTLLSLGAAVACGPELDPIGFLNNTRIIGVKKSAPYAAPGETVKLTMLWEDGTEGGVRDAETFFGFWCVNPSGDLWADCLRQAPSVEPTFVFNQNEFTIEIPEDTLRTKPQDPTFPPNGTAFVFYGVCSGTLLFGGQPVAPPSGGGAGGFGGDAGSPGAAGSAGAGGSSSGDSPIGLPTCVDDAGNEVGADDFIFGYSTIFIYEGIRNADPVVTGFQQEGRDVAFDCIGADCAAPMAVPDLDGCQDGVICIDRCEDDGDVRECPEVRLAPVIDPDSIEDDEVARIAYGRELGESVWVSYFVDRGRISDVRLVNDATAGFNEEYTGKFAAPREPGPIRIWAAVRDNRGGIEWIRAPGYVR